MNKAELVSVMAQKSGLTKKETEVALNALLEAVQGALQLDEKVILVGFGAFEMRAKAARKGLNPRTKQAIDIPATTVPVFKAGKEFKMRVSGTEQPAK